ncbi:hypothetical protein LBMAG53_02760 [Planctomycetota bacterium]|nr:hypothetical protein LBMAG53_02760 [Planctomycetota bacterium]
MVPPGNVEMTNYTVATEERDELLMSDRLLRRYVMANSLFANGTGRGNYFMILIFLCFFVVLFGVENTGRIAVGQDIIKCRELMKNFGNGGILLEFELTRPERDVNMWRVGDGIIIAIYGTQDNIITSIYFYISDGKPKGESYSKFFNVSEYEPASNKITLLLTGR